MSDDSVSVRFGADTAPLQEGAATSAAAIEAFGAQVADISAAINAQTAAMQASFAELGETITSAMASAKAATAEEEVELQGLLATVRGGVESFNELKESVMGFGELLMAAFAVHEIDEFVRSLGEAGERVQHTAQAFGMTTGEVQRLQAVFTAAGAGPEVLQGAMMRLDRAASQAVSGDKRVADAFKDLGVNLAQPMTAAQRMQEVLQGFANIPGPQRAAVATGVFGRNIMQIAPLLGLTKDQLDEYNAEADRFGAVNETAVGHMAALGAALNENKVAMAGLQNVLGDALSGAFIGIIKDIDDLVAAFTQSYNTGGEARQAMDLLSFSVQALRVSFEVLGDVMVTVYRALVGGASSSASALNVLHDVIGGIAAAVITMGTIVESVAALISGAVEVCGVEFSHFEEIAVAVAEAMSGNLAGAARDVAAAMRDAGKAANEAGDQIAAAFARGQAKLDSLSKPFANPSEDSPKSVAGTPPRLGGEKTARKPKDDALAEWTEQLRQIDDEQQNWYADQNALAVKFWQSIVASHAGSLKDQQEAEDRLAEAKKALDQGDLDSVIKTAEKKAEAAKGNVAEVQAIYAALEDALKARHAQGGDDWKKVEEAKTEAVRKATEQQLQDQEKLWRAQAKAQASAIEANAKVADMKSGQRGKDIDAQEADGQLSPAQALAAHIALVKQEAAADQAAARAAYDTKVAALENEYLAEAQNSDKQRQVGQELLEVKQSFDNQQAISAQQTADKVEDYQRAAAQRSAEEWRNNISSIVDSFGSGFLGMARGQESFRGAMLKVAEDFENMWMKAIEKAVLRFILGEETKGAVAQTSQATQTAATTAGVAAGTAAEQGGALMSLAITLETTMKEIGQYAAKAAAAAWSALAGIPVIGPALGAGAAAATFAGVEGLAASAAGGYDIPAGVNPVTQLHAQEMVLPASIANPLRGMISAGGSGGGGGQGGPWGSSSSSSSVSFGDTHIHASPRMNRSDFEGMLSDHRDVLAAHLKGEARAGRLKFA